MNELFALKNVVPRVLMGLRWGIPGKLVLSSLLTAALILVGRLSAAGQTDRAEKPIPATPPPMGWSSWNSFSNTIDSKIVVAQADALIASGMKDAGYQYVNIDEGWWLGERDAQGNIVVEAERWPAMQPGERAGDMANIVRYLHSRGLKAGIYTDAGEAGCSFYGPDIGPPMPHTGSEGYYDQDVLQFAQWGFDYVKVDWCGGNGEKLNSAFQYAAFARAIAKAEKATGRRLYFSICEWGSSKPWTWAAGVGGVNAAIWRTGGDIVGPIVASNPKSKVLAASVPHMLENFDNNYHPQAQHTGYYNDADMMVLGMPGLTDVQNRLHMSLWALSGSPLICGADLTKLSKAQIGMLTNREILAIDQDALGLQAIKVDEAAADLQVWAKPLATEGDHAVLLLNRTAEPATISVNFGKIGLDALMPAKVRDVWAGKDLGEFTSEFSTTVPGGDAVVLLVHGKNRESVRYEAAKRRAGDVEPLTIPIKPLHGPTFVQIAYKLGGKEPVISELSVDGQTATRVLFKPTGEGAGVIVVGVDSKQTQALSALSFAAMGLDELTIESIAVLP